MDFIIKPFNGLYFASFGFAIALIILIWLIFRKKSQRTKEIFIISSCAFLMVFFFVYKYFLSIDKEFLAVSVPPIDKFNWYSELPLQLCNINMFLIPIGILTKKRGFLGFAFFLAPVGALMAIVFPEKAFDGFSLLLPRMIGYYGTHFLLIILGISLATLGIFRPKFSDIPGILITFGVLAFIIHIVNLILIKTGLCDFANYFFTMRDADISVLHLFYKIIPVPFLYLLPALLILAVYMGIISLLFSRADKRTQRKESKKEKELVNI